MNNIFAAIFKPLKEVLSVHTLYEILLKYEQIILDYSEQIKFVFYHSLSEEDFNSIFLTDDQLIELYKQYNIYNPYVFYSQIVTNEIIRRNFEEGIFLNKPFTNIQRYQIAGEIINLVHNGMRN